MTSPPNERQRKNTYFAMILYPENSMHMGLLKYIESIDYMCPCIWIKHEAESEEKKEHIHVMYKAPQASTVSSELKFFAGQINHLECVNNPFHYALYMIHGTPESINKKRYELSDINGSSKLLQKIFGKTQILRNLENIIDKAIENDGVIFNMIKDIISDENADALLETYNKFSYTIIAGAKQVYENVKEGIKK